MTREQIVMAEAIKMSDARRMAEVLRTQAHEEGNARIIEDVHGTRSAEVAQPSERWSALPTT